MALPYDNPKPRKCLICGDEFLPKTRQGKYCDKIHYNPCPICGKPVEIKNVRQIGKTCGSLECKAAKRASTNIERYGVEKPQGLDIILEKKRQTVREKYGVDYITQVDEIKKRQAASRSKTLRMQKDKSKDEPLSM